MTHVWNQWTNPATWGHSRQTLFFHFSLCKVGAILQGCWVEQPGWGTWGGQPDEQKSGNSHSISLLTYSDVNMEKSELTLYRLLFLLPQQVAQKLLGLRPSPNADQIKYLFQITLSLFFSVFTVSSPAEVFHGHDKAVYRHYHGNSAGTRCCKKDCIHVVLFWSGRAPRAHTHPSTHTHILKNSVFTVSAVPKARTHIHTQSNPRSSQWMDWTAVHLMRDLSRQEPKGFGCGVGGRQLPIIGNKFRPKTH